MDNASLDNEAGRSSSVSSKEFKIDSYTSLDFETVKTQVTSDIITQFREERLEILWKWYMFKTVITALYDVIFWLLGTINNPLIFIGWGVFLFFNICFGIYIKVKNKVHLVKYGLIAKYIFFIALFF